MRTMSVLRLFLVPAVLLAAGCAPVISQEVIDQVAPGIGFTEVFQDPEAYRGKVVLWAGVIVETLNREEGTLLEVLQKPAAGSGRPREIDHSEGRFLALYDGFLDAVIYAEGKEITVAGEVQGKRVKPLGELDYTYPLISIKDLYLWPSRTRELLYPYPLYPYPDPYYYWYRPRWWRYHHPHWRPR